MGWWVEGGRDWDEQEVHCMEEEPHQTVHKERHTYMYITANRDGYRWLPVVLGTVHV